MPARDYLYFFAGGLVLSEREWCAVARASIAGLRHKVRHNFTTALFTRYYKSIATRGRLAEVGEHQLCKLAK